MKRVIYIFIAVMLLASGGATAQMRSSYFVEGSQFRNELNPALAPTRGYISLLGGLGMSVGSNFLSVDNFLYEKNGEIVTALHNSVSSEEFFAKMPTTAKMNINANINVFGLGFYTKKMFWTFGANLRSQNRLSMSDDIFRAVKTLGNGMYDLSDTSLSSTTYLEAYLGSSFRLCDWINLGVKAKFLVGLLNASTEMQQIQANVGAESITAQVRGTLRGAGLILSSANIMAGEEFAVEDIINADKNYIMGNFRSMGAAIDIGTEFRLLNDHLRISAAVADLGFIRWDAQSHVAAAANADFVYNGFNIESGEMDGDFSADLKALHTADRDYTTQLAWSLNVGVEYNILRNHIAFGVLSHTEFAGSSTMSELTASVNFRPSHWISATVSHTFLNGNRPDVLGFVFNLHPDGLNIFAGVDYLGLSMVKWGNVSVPRYQKSINAYLGFSFNFGRPKFLKPAKRTMLNDVADSEA